MSRRLLDALRNMGIDARMFVTERLTDSKEVELIASKARIKSAFVADRLRIALANGFNRATLFKLDAAAAGIDVSKNKFIQSADVVMLNWINQGVMSLRGIEKLLRSGKKVIWAMHDMWNFTGLCHHAGRCEGYDCSEPGGGRCGLCPLLGRFASRKDFSYRINDRKDRTYSAGNIEFVAVSSWLASKASTSRLLGRRRVSVIPNAFPVPDLERVIKGRSPRNDGKIRMVIGAARLDDSVKDFPMLIAALGAFKRKYPELADKTVLTLFGGLRDRTLLDYLPIENTFIGEVYDKSKIEEIYLSHDIVLSTSKWETLPGTLIEGQAYGCLPIAFNSGGQCDIIDDGLTGVLVQRCERRDCVATEEETCANDAERFADGIKRGVEMVKSGNESLQMAERLHESVSTKFNAEEIARRYLKLIDEM